MLTPVMILTALGLFCGFGLGWAARRLRAQSDPLIERIDALLPQTQCGRCGYPGCRPYAEAVSSGQADINQCPPGGEAVIRALADLLGQHARPLHPGAGAEQARTVAVIDESRCIGCALCIQACPVDAIVGAAKLMHTVIRAECTGCNLCLPPCPVDCIGVVPAAADVAQRPRPRPKAGGQPEMPCIRCGECARVCPALLLPQQLHLQVRHGLWDQAAAFGLAACTECGACDVVCPSRIPLTEWFGYGRDGLRRHALEREASGAARARVQSRQARLARDERERAEKLARRKQLLKEQAGGQGPGRTVPG